MTAYELRDRYQAAVPDGHFFDAATLRFFGETMGKMKVSGPETVKDWYGKTHSCWVLLSWQKKHPLGPRWIMHYFDTNTYDVVLT